MAAFYNEPLTEISNFLEGYLKRVTNDETWTKLKLEVKLSLESDIGINKVCISRLFSEQLIKWRLWLKMDIRPLWCSGYHHGTTSYNKAWTQVLHRFNSCLQHVRDSQWWRSLTMVLAGYKPKCLSSVNHTPKTIHHHHQWF